MEEATSDETVSVSLYVSNSDFSHSKHIPSSPVYIFGIKSILFISIDDCSCIKTV